MSDEWMFDAQVLMMDVPTVDGRILTGQARFGLPLPLTMFVDDDETDVLIVAAASEARCVRGDAWFSMSGIIARPDVFPILEHGFEYGTGIEVPTTSYSAYHGETLAMHNPVIAGAMIYRPNGRRLPAFEGAALTLIAP